MHATIEIPVLFHQVEQFGVRKDDGFLTSDGARPRFPGGFHKRSSIYGTDGWKEDSGEPARRGSAVRNRSGFLFPICRPWPKESVLTTLLTLCVFLMMLCIGLDFSWPHLKSLLRSPRPLCVGLFAQNVVVPLVGYGVAWCFRESPEIALAIILIVASPGGPAANAIVHYAGARIDLSISLTAINGLLCLFTAPLIANWGFLLLSGSGVSLRLPAGPTISHILLIILLPILLGGLLRRFSRSLAPRLTLLAHRGTMIMLMAVLTLVFLLSFDRIRESLWLATQAVSLLCFLMLTVGALISRLFRLEEALRFTIANEISVHNMPLALLMAEGILHRPELAGTIVIYVPVIFLMSVLYARRYRRRHAGKA